MPDGADAHSHDRADELCVAVVRQRADRAEVDAGSEAEGGEIAHERSACHREGVATDAAGGERRQDVRGISRSVGRSSGRGVATADRAFDPLIPHATFPGASPFRVRGPQYARALLEAARPVARAEHDHLFAFVEGDAPLEDALVSVGATAALRTVRMEGVVASLRP